MATFAFFFLMCGVFVLCLRRPMFRGQPPEPQSGQTAAEAIRTPGESRP
jgi:hypothetical protein